MNGGDIDERLILAIALSVVSVGVWFLFIGDIRYRHVERLEVKFEAAMNNGRVESACTLASMLATGYLRLDDYEGYSDWVRQKAEVCSYVRAGN